MKRDPSTDTAQVKASEERNAQIQRNIQSLHARMFPDGCDPICDACLIRVRLPEAKAMLENRTLKLPTKDHLRALDLYHSILSGDARL
jgi:hypothetical protein